MFKCQIISLVALCTHYWAQFMSDLYHIFCMFVHTHAHIHSFTHSVIQLLWRPVVSNHQYPQLCSMYLVLELMPLVFFSLSLFSHRCSWCFFACFFLTEAVRKCFLFSLSTDVAASCLDLFYFFIVFSYHFFLSLSRFPFFFFALSCPPLSDSALICVKYFNKKKWINKQYLGIKGSFIFIKPFLAKQMCLAQHSIQITVLLAMMLDRTR